MGGECFGHQDIVWQPNTCQELCLHRYLEIHRKKDRKAAVSAQGQVLLLPQKEMGFLFLQVSGNLVHPAKPLPLSGWVTLWWLDWFRAIVSPGSWEVRGEQCSCQWRRWGKRSRRTVDHSEQPPLWEVLRTNNPSLDEGQVLSYGQGICRRLAASQRTEYEREGLQVVWLNL